LASPVISFSDIRQNVTIIETLEGQSLDHNRVRVASENFFLPLVVKSISVLLISVSKTGDMVKVVPNLNFGDVLISHVDQLPWLSVL